MNKTNNKSIRQQKERAAGIDIHKNKAVVCFYIGDFGQIEHSISVQSEQ